MGTVLLLCLAVISLQSVLALAREVHLERQGLLTAEKEKSLHGRSLRSHGLMSGSQMTPEEEEEDRREFERMLQSGGPSFGLRAPRLSSGPSMGNLNITFYRWDSVQPESSNIDWRKRISMTPILRQFYCQSCWAIAAVDSIALMWAVINKDNSAYVSPVLSAQQVCDCGVKQCCQGGWPEWAFAYVLFNAGVTNTDNYPYMGRDSTTCALPTGVPLTQITGWESVPAFSALQLMKAVTVQPILVFFSASDPSFVRYKRSDGVYSGANCTNDINHVLIVVGYDVSAGYWIVKNSWFGSWGDGGYAYVAMSDGAGTCGMLQVPPLYPVYYPVGPQPVQISSGEVKRKRSSDGEWWKSYSEVRDPCNGVIDPCGGGDCYSNGDGVARCKCPSKYVEQLGVPTSKCVVMDVCNDNPLFNPCGGGICTNVWDGTYTCTCNSGYVLGTRADGAPTCVPVSASSGSKTYKSIYGDTCASIQTALNVAPDQFIALNPFVDCANAIPPGTVIIVGGDLTTGGCAVSYTINGGDNCDSLVKQASNLASSSRTAIAAASVTDILSLNPGLSCSRGFYKSQQVCLARSSSATPPPVCSKTYVTVKGDTVSTVATKAKIDTTTLATINPGLRSTAVFPPGINLCIGTVSASSTTSISSSSTSTSTSTSTWTTTSTSTSTASVTTVTSTTGATTTPPPTAGTCTRTYTVVQGDTCPTIWNAANLTQIQFLAINPGIRCQAPFLQIGQVVCINATGMPSSSGNNTLITYRTNPGDTFASVSAAYSFTCDGTTTESLAAYNGRPTMTVFAAGETVLVPCNRRAGLIDCGCGPSLFVCSNQDFNTYTSFCDAQCNYALPVTSGACGTCSQNCVGRAGYAPTTVASGCSAICPYPQWGPDPVDITSVVGLDAPRCTYIQTTCENVCNAVALKFNSAAAGTTCYQKCACCTRLPCNIVSCIDPTLCSLSPSRGTWSGGQCFANCNTYYPAPNPKP